MNLMPCPICGKDDKVGPTFSGTSIECSRCHVDVGAKDGETAAQIWNAIAPQKERATMTTLAKRASHIYADAKVKFSRGGHGIRDSYDLMSGTKLVEYAETLPELMKKIDKLQSAAVGDTAN